MAHFFRLISCFLLFTALAYQPANAGISPSLEWGPGSCNAEFANSNYPHQGHQIGGFKCTNDSPTSRSCGFDTRSYDGSSFFYPICGQTKDILACPSNSLLVGNECKCSTNYKEEGNACVRIPLQCPAGEFDNGSSCVPKPPKTPEELAEEERGDCKIAAGFENSTFSPGYEDATVAGLASSGKIICMPTPNLPPGRGCTVEFWRDVSYQNKGKWISEGTIRRDMDITLPCSLVPDQDGQSNDLPIPAIPEKTCPFGQPGQINGVDVCVPVKPDSETESRKVTQDEKILPDGTKEVTTTTTTTNCKDRMCMTVTDKKVSSTPGSVTNPPPGGGGPEVPPGGKKLPDGSVWSPTGPTTTTGAGSLGGATPPAGAASGAGSNTGSAGVVTESKSDFCTKNPKDKQCGQQGDGQGGFGGACGAGFKCDGDAVQCAMALEQHKMNCKLYEPDNESDSLFNKARGDRDGYSKAELDAKATQVSVTTFNSNGLGWARSCPANPVIPLSFARGSNSFEIPFSRICGPLSILALAGVGITLLGSMLWVLGGKK